ncbi:MAG: monovalent cation/H+ antiporter subunit D family protein [Alphaproteobacteria bacterium]|nr:monovalent cation/H+ antiporter subunit D family protein [Alphaproteobacteria bacterium]
MNAFIDFYAAPPGLTAHAAPLLVIGPLIAACAAALSPSTRSAWMISVGGTIFAFWMALCLAGEVARNGVVNYYMGGFAPPLGIAFRIDALGVMFALLISGIGVMAALFSGHTLEAEIMKGKRRLYQSGFLLCVAGLLGLSATGDAFNAFVFLEVSSIGTYALIGVGVDRRALPAAFNYLVMGTIGATFFVIGVGFLYAATGTLNMADMSGRLATLGDSRVVEAGFAFIVIGLGLKAAMFPLHGWLPAAYAYAPSLMGVFLSATATKAALYLMARFLFTVFGPHLDFVGLFLTWVMAPVAGAAAIICSAQAIFQTDIRRILAFSSVAQVGYIMLGVSMASAEGVSAGLFHLFNQALIKSALFMALGGLAFNIKATKLSDFSGVGRTAPWTMTAFAIGTFSLAGVPLTAGFLSKWRLIEAAFAAHWLWAVGVIAVSSLLGLIYAGRMLETIFFRAPVSEERAGEARFGVLVPLWILAAASVWYGLDASLPVDLSTAAAQALGLAPAGAAP